VSDWVSVKERLPEHNQDVIAITKAGNLSVGQNIVTCTFCKPRNEKHGLFYLPYTMGRNLIVTHWMPLPNPPKEEQMEKHCPICRHCQRGFFCPSRWYCMIGEQAREVSESGTCDKWEEVNNAKL
jgi:hypothetical protein